MNLGSFRISLRHYSVCFNIKNIFRVFGDCDGNFVFLNQINKNSRGEKKVPVGAMAW